MTATLAGGSPPSRMAAVLRLTRWREHLPYVVPLSLLGGLIAARATGRTIGWSLALVLAANILANCLAYMVNDIEDAEDDARDPHRTRRNAVAHGDLSPRLAWAASLACGIGSLALYAAAGWPRGDVVACGGAILLLSVLYSWRRVRLKALPVIDVLSHVLMLGGLLLLAGYLAVAPLEGPWLAPVAMVSLFSAYGQFYNQLRDFEVDRLAGLRNTALTVGRPATRALLVASLVGAVLCIGWMTLDALVPLWTLGVGGVAGLASWGLRARAWKGRREAAMVDRTEEGQKPMLDAVNALAFAWLVAVLFG